MQKTAGLTAVFPSDCTPVVLVVDTLCRQLLSSDLLDGGEEVSAGSRPSGTSGHRNTSNPLLMSCWDFTDVPLRHFTLGWPYVPFIPDASWSGFLYCLYYLGFGFVCVCRLIGVVYDIGSLCFRNALKVFWIKVNIEILARTRPRTNGTYGHPSLHEGYKCYLLFVIITRVIVIRIIKQIFSLIYKK